jgi:8-oxo-dGTP pyrophosphatase MutT (NUDIX family)
MSSRRASQDRAAAPKAKTGRQARGASSKQRAADAGRAGQGRRAQVEGEGEGKTKAPRAKAGSKARDSERQPRGTKAKGASKQARGAAKAAGAPARTPRSRAGPREVSAGGVVVRGKEVAVIVPTRRAADGARVLTLPKGHVDPGETPVQAAAREVREEAGVVAEPVRELGESRYWYRRDGRTIGKSVYFFLFRYLGGDTKDHDEEVEEARWIPLEDAEKELTYPAEREMVARAREYLKEGERKDR